MSERAARASRLEPVVRRRPLTPSEKLAARLRSDLGLDIVNLRPANRGHHREDGVIKWVARCRDGSEYESEDTVRECLRAARLDTRTPPFWSQATQIDATPNAGLQGRTREAGESLCKPLLGEEGEK